MTLSTKLMVIGVVTIMAVAGIFAVGAVTGWMLQASLTSMIVLLLSHLYSHSVRKAETVERYLRENLPPTAHFEEI